MKKTLLFTLLTLLGMSQAAAQEYEYVPFVREGVKWVYAIKDYDVWHVTAHYPAYGDCIVHRTLELRGDTVINGKVYKAMHKCVDDEISEPRDEVPVYLREEDKVVYGIVPDREWYPDAVITNIPFSINYWIIDNEAYTGEEFVLYDFNDPIAYWEQKMPVSFSDLNYPPFQVDTIIVGDHLAKRYISGSSGSWDDAIMLIEGIGFISFNSYPLAFCLPVSTSTHPQIYSLESVIEDGEYIYGSAGDRYMPLLREDVKWVNERVVVNHGDTTCNYYTYEFKGNHPMKDTYKALYRYDGRSHELDVESDSLVAGLKEHWKDIRYLNNEPLNNVISQGRDMIGFTAGYLYMLIGSLDGNGTCKNYYIDYQKEQFLNDENFVEAEPIMIDGYRCSRLAYIGENGDTLAYVVEGIGFDSRDMGDLLTPFTRKPDPDADYQEYCGLSHVVKDGKVIYKGLRWREETMTGIDEVVAEPTRRPVDENYYDLTGRPVGKQVPTAPGIYIHQGKKICVSHMP